MLSVSNEAIAAPQNPELQLVEPTPEQLFAEHVALATEADMLDVQRSIKAHAIGAFVMAAGGVSGLIFTSEKPGFTPFVGMGLTVAAAWFGYFRQKRNERHVIANHEQVADKAKKATGHDYELYRLKDGKIAMHWRGTVEKTNDVAKSLEEAALLAERHDIETMCIDYGTVTRMALRPVGTWLPGTLQTIKSWLKQHKNIELDVQPELQEASPAEWVEHARSLVCYEKLEGLHSLFDMLAEVDSENPLLKLYQNMQSVLAETPQQERAEVENRIKEMLLEKVQPYLKGLLDPNDSVRFSLKGDYSFLPLEHLPTRINQRLDIKLDGDDVVYWRGNWVHARANLERELDLNPEVIDFLVKRPKADPQRAKIAMLYLLYNECRGVPKYIFQADDAPTTLQAEGSLGMGYQDFVTLLHRHKGTGEALHKEVSGRHWRIHGGLAALTVIGGVLGYLVDNRYAAVEYDANRQIVAEQGLDPQYGEAEPAEVRRLMGEWNGLNTTWGAILDVRKAISINPFKIEGASEEYAANTFSQVGNIGQQPDRVEYKLEASGMELGGYWWQRTANTLIGEKHAMYWRHYYEPTDFGPIQTDVGTRPDVIRPYIHVTHGIDSRHEGTRVDVGKDGQEKGIIVPIPVREGTKISAAALDGKPVKIRQLNDNTYTVFFWLHDDIRKGKLEYWLTPDTGENRVRNIRPFALEGEILNGGPNALSPAEVEARLTARWSEEIPGFAQMDADTRRTAIDTHIKNEMKYNTDPLDPTVVYDSPIKVDFVDEVLDEDEANCNVAGVLRKLSVDNNMEVGVFGYSNSGAGQNVLTTRERHAALVNDKREIIDDTPWRSVDIEQYNNDNRPKSPLEPWMLIPGVLGLAGLTYKKRRVLHAGTQKAVEGLVQYDARRAKRKLERTKPHKRMLAAGLAEFVSFAPEFEIAAARRHSVQQSPGVADQKLQQPYIHSKATKKLLAKQEDVPRFVTRTLRRARRAARVKQTDK